MGFARLLFVTVHISTGIEVRSIMSKVKIYLLLIQWLGKEVLSEEPFPNHPIHLIWIMSSPILKSSEQTSNKICTASCLKTTGLYDDLLLLSSLFHFFYFIFSVPISFSSCFPISPSLCFFYVLSQAFSKSSRKAFVYIHIYIYIYTHI